MTPATQPRVIVLTGATAGIGYEAAKQLGAQGQHLVLVGRSDEKLAATARVVAGTGAAQVDTERADFASLRSVGELADRLLAAYPHVDVLLDNAGGVNKSRTLTADGNESTFAVNHLAAFLLTERLKDLLVHSAPARIVLTSSAGHYRGTMDFDDLGFASEYTIMRAYCRSKLANVLYMRDLAAELAGTGVTVNAFHPGAIATDIWSGAPGLARPMLGLAKRFMRTPEDGGRALAYLATSQEVEGITGSYFEKDRPKEPSPIACDPEIGARLRTESERLVGL